MKAVLPEKCPCCSKTPTLYAIIDTEYQYYMCSECKMCSRPAGYSDPVQAWNKLVEFIKKKPMGYTIEPKDILKSMIDNPNTHYCCIHRAKLELEKFYYYYFDDKKGRFKAVNKDGEEIDTNVFESLEPVWDSLIWY